MADLPFRLLDSGLGRLSKLVHASTDVLRSMIGREAASEAVPPAATEAADASEQPGDALAPTASLGETAASSAALASALDRQGTADLAEHAASGAAKSAPTDVIPDAMIVTGDDQDAPAPDEELGPEPFTPQVGP